ncbi:endonuclease/exonuclease/phosphatase family protein [Patulibacter sp.]|uniref:endonuclease/exonuclease/phosphatase family protein n=1 Tax=Patulibacter sp. TaxID=1912859 RepID=UPI00271993E7|nr:endonuclease/exonuclease/phosphatase family protein [Patulibacter sp.]MDO9407590.1 endonuclease/exonuclease/phosphatase family protein [Patulibacter sp.]
MLRVATWNLFHGRADPPAGRPLLHEFAVVLAGWSWDVALLQEVPPWWPPLLARACGAQHRTAPTSRNALLPVRRAIAARRPDLLRSNGGGSNAILVRPPLTITAHGLRRLRWLPERRVAHAVRLGGVERPSADGLWVGNAHGQKGEWDDGPGLERPLADLRTAVARLEAWGSADAPLLLGGDLNLPREAVAAALPAGWTRIATSGPDHVVGRGLEASGDSWRPARSTLSDHAALVVDVEDRR